MIVPGASDEGVVRRRRIDCPVHGCTGSWLDHGGDGSEPDDWTHDFGGLALGPSASVYRTRFGAGPVEWSLAMAGASIATDTDPRAIAEMLRTVAASLDTAADDWEKTSERQS